MKTGTFIVALCCFGLVAASPFPGETYFPGYITLEGNYRLFYTFFRSRDHNPNAPFIIWIQGGPGCAATTSMLDETGPFEINEDLTLGQRKYSVNDFADVLFVDQPLGTGFSNCSDRERIPKDGTGMLRDMKTFYGKFLDKFPELKARGVYLVGQSYAGHYIPVLAKGFIEAGFKVNGAAINNGWYKPEVHVGMRGHYAARHGLTSPFQLALGRILETVEVAVAGFGWLNIAGGIEYIVAGLYQGFEHKRFNEYDIRLPCPDEFSETGCYNTTLLEGFINRTDVRRELGVADRDYKDCNDDIADIMQADFYSDISPYVIELLNKYELKMVFYDGEYDFMCDIDGQRKWMDTLEWKHKDNMLSQAWHKWYIGGEPMGEYRAYGNVVQAVVYNAGHLVTLDQPAVMLDAVHRLIYDMKQC